MHIVRLSVTIEQVYFLRGIGLASDGPLYSQIVSAFPALAITGNRPLQRAES